MREIRKDQITFTRFIAAIAIVIFHKGVNVFPFSDASVSFIFKSANVGVSYFFTLSGFIMMIAYANSAKIEAFEYYRNRIARIAPAYYLALILVIPSIVSKWSEYDYLGLALNVAMLQAWIPSEALSVNTPGWSLSVEWLFYLLFPFLFNLVYKRYKFWLILVCGVIFFLASQVLHNALLHSDFFRDAPSLRNGLIFYFPPMHLNEFLMGNIAGLFYIRYMSNRSQPNGFWIILLVMALLAFMKIPIGISLQNGFLIIIFIPLILLMSSDSGIFSRVMSLKPLVYLGEISFGIYILQKASFNFCHKIYSILGKSSPDIIFFTHLILLCFISGLSLKFIEAPLRRRIKKMGFAPKYQVKSA